MLRFFHLLLKLQGLSDHTAAFRHFSGVYQLTEVDAVVKYNVSGDSEA